MQRRRAPAETRNSGSRRLASRPRHCASRTAARAPPRPTSCGPPRGRSGSAIPRCWGAWCAGGSPGWRATSPSMLCSASRRSSSWRRRALAGLGAGGADLDAAPRLPAAGAPRRSSAHWSQARHRPGRVRQLGRGGPGRHAALAAEARVQGLGSQGRLGVAAVRPLVRAFQNLVGSEGITAAVRRAEQGPECRAGTNQSPEGGDRAGGRRGRRRRSRGLRRRRCPHQRRRAPSPPDRQRHRSDAGQARSPVSGATPARAAPPPPVRLRARTAADRPVQRAGR